MAVGRAIVRDMTKKTMNESSIRPTVMTMRIPKNIAGSIVMPASSIM